MNGIALLVNELPILLLSTEIIIRENMKAFLVYTYISDLVFFSFFSAFFVESLTIVQLCGFLGLDPQAI